MGGPDVVGVRPDPFGWVMIGLAGVAVLLMVLASVGLFVAWIGAVVNTASLVDKTWFIVLLVGGLASVGIVVTLAYVIAGPEGWQPSVPARDAGIAQSQQTEAASDPVREAELTSR